jgi:hypothetical protein
MTKVLDLMQLETDKSDVCALGESPQRETPKGYTWQPLKVTVDSGACDHVIPLKEINTEEVRMTEAVRQGVQYTTANGSKLPNLGEVRIEGITEEDKRLNLTFQVAGVKKPLGSVRKMCAAGNRVVFESDGQGGYVENTRTGARIPIRREGGTYGVTVWRLRKVEPGGRASSGSFEALCEDDEDVAEDEFGAKSSSSTSFTRRA